MTSSATPPPDPPNDCLAPLLQLGRMLNSSLELHEVLETAIEQVIQFVGAERGFILLVDTDTGRVWGEAVRNIDRASLEATLSATEESRSAEISRTLVESVLDTRQPVISMNAMEDPRFASRQSVQFHNLRSILCVPLVTKARLLGVIYVDNRLKSGVFTEDHLAMLAAFANQAAVAIDNARLYANLRRSMEERLRLQDELHGQETRRLALEEANRLKSEFIGFLAHEIRNPLTMIRGSMQTLLADPEHPLDLATQQELFEAVEADSDRLLDMMNELLNISRLESGRQLAIAIKPVALAPLLQRLARRHRYSQYITDRHRILTDLAPDLPETIDADVEKLTQIVSNLLSNAIKYAPNGGDIRLIALTDGPDKVIIRVQDCGVGLSADECHQLFHQYERLERDAIRNIPGTGLGLYLVKNLVELHGGTISVESTPNVGSTFIVRLPRTHPPV